MTNTNSPCAGPSATPPNNIACTKAPPSRNSGQIHPSSPATSTLRSTARANQAQAAPAGPVMPAALRRFAGAAASTTPTACQTTAGQEVRKTMSGIDFSKLAKLQDATCPDCGRTHQTHNADSGALCHECALYQEHPELAPKYWTWASTGPGQWAAVCVWPEHENPPEPGQVIKVHRKDGSSSRKTITGLRYTSYDPSGRFQVRCDVN